MDTWILWLIIIGCLLIIEVLTQMLWALCLAAGCVFGIIATLCGLNVFWQIGLTAVGSFGAYIFLVPLFQKWHAMQVDKKGRASRTGMDALVGRRTVVSQEITPEHPGRARIDGDNWQITTDQPNQTLRRGTEVVVVGYDSIILKVKPV